MEIYNATFAGSFVRTEHCPTDIRAEFVFIGRSNVGKSSLINMLCNQKYLAKVSGTPGKTQTINYFDIEKKWYMVDLPGYGYARVSRTQRTAWERMIFHFLKNRQQIRCIFVLVDGMIPPQQIDIDFMRKLGELQLPFAILYTKTDRLKGEDLKKNLNKIREAILKYFDELPNEFITSAEKRHGKREVLEFIDSLI